MRIPYEIWITAATGEEYQLATVFYTEELTDAQAVDAAQVLLQSIIDKVETPTPDTVIVKRGLIFPGRAHTRRYKRQQDLES